MMSNSVGKVVIEWVRSATHPLHDREVIGSELA